MLGSEWPQSEMGTTEPGLACERIGTRESKCTRSSTGMAGPACEELCKEELGPVHVASKVGRAEPIQTKPLVDIGKPN